MKYRRESQQVFIRLETGEDLHTSVVELAEREGITGGAVTALGAVRDVVLGYYNLERRDYDRTSVPGEVELASAVGTLSRLDGKPHLHLHAVVSDRGCRTYGGHLFSATTAATVELFVRVADAPIERTPDEATGLSLWRV